MGGEDAKQLFEYLVSRVEALMKKNGGTGTVETGQFGAMMQVALTNDGPVTITVDSPPTKAPNEGGSKKTKAPKPSKKRGRGGGGGSGGGDGSDGAGGGGDSKASAAAAVAAARGPEPMEGVVETNVVSANEVAPFFAEWQRLQMDIWHEHFGGGGGGGGGGGDPQRQGKEKAQESRVEAYLDHVRLSYNNFRGQRSVDLAGGGRGAAAAAAAGGGGGGAGGR